MSEGVSEVRERNWVPLAVAAGLVIAVVVAALTLGHRPEPTASAANGAPDPYAKSLVLSNIAMSESGNLAGGKLTYLDGHVANTGPSTVSGITVQVLFRNAAHEVTQNEILPLRLIRMREPYIDTQLVSAAPIKSGGEQDFRLIFDTISPEWDGAYPEVKITHVEAK